MHQCIIITFFLGLSRLISKISFHLIFFDPIIPPNFILKFLVNLFINRAGTRSDIGLGTISLLRLRNGIFFQRRRRYNHWLGHAETDQKTDDTFTHIPPPDFLISDLQKNFLFFSKKFF